MTRLFLTGFLLAAGLGSPGSAPLRLVPARPAARPAASRPAVRPAAAVTVEVLARAVAEPVLRPAVRPTAAVTVEALARAVADQVNDARRKAGVGPLLVDPRLQRAAQRYSQELSWRGTLDHQSPTPGRHTFLERLQAEGARPRKAAENLAMLNQTPRLLARHVVLLWLNSPGHRRNLLDPAYTRTGVGVWPGRNGVWYVTQEFASSP